MWSGETDKLERLYIRPKEICGTDEEEEIETRQPETAGQKKRQPETVEQGKRQAEYKRKR